MRRYAAVLLDIDGTLIDSNDAHAHSWCDALHEFDLNADFASVRRLIGKGGDKLLSEVAGLSDVRGLGKQVANRRKQIFQSAYLPTLRPFPRSKDLVARLRDDGLALGIATSAARDEMGALLEIIGIQSLVDIQTSSDDADRSKPDPDILLAAIQKLEIAPTRTLMLGDTPYDIEAAGRIRVSTIALLSGGWDAEALAAAARIYRDCADLHDRFDQSPFARG